MKSLQKLKSVSQLSRKRIGSLEKMKIDTIKVLISKALVDSYISQDEFAPVNNVLREYDEMEKEIKKRNAEKYKQSFSAYISLHFSFFSYERNGIKTIVDNDE